MKKLPGKTAYTLPGKQGVGRRQREQRSHTKVHAPSKRAFVGSQAGRKLPRRGFEQSQVIPMKRKAPKQNQSAMPKNSKSAELSALYI